MRRRRFRLLAAALGCYLALALCRLSGELSAAAQTHQALLDQKQALEEFSAALSETQLRAWAFREWGLVAAEDVVFFDGG